MYEIRRTPEFDDWFGGIRDQMTRLRLNRRLSRALLGNLGDIKPVGHSVWEMRESFGPGWRMYYVQRDGVLVVMLGGGDKATQPTDINRAIDLAATLED